jgi:hypothetical protein
MDSPDDGAVPHANILTFRHLCLTAEQMSDQMRAALFLSGGPPSLVYPLVAELAPVVARATASEEICFADLSPEAAAQLVRCLNQAMAIIQQRNLEIFAKLFLYAIEAHMRRLGLVMPGQPFDRGDAEPAEPEPARRAPLLVPSDDPATPDHQET